jgi:hypothetical protein
MRSHRLFTAFSDGSVKEMTTCLSNERLQMEWLSVTEVDERALSA